MTAKTTVEAVRLAEMCDLKLKNEILKQQVERHLSIQFFLRNELRSIEHENFELKTKQIEKMVLQSVNSDEIDNLKQDFDKTRYLHTQQIFELEEQVRELNEENVKLKQDISNDKHQVASSSFLRHKTMEEQLAKISEAIDETQRKRPRLDTNDEQLKKKHTDEVAKLNTTVNALKTEMGKKNAEILELQSRVTELVNTNEKDKLDRVIQKDRINKLKDEINDLQIELKAKQQIEIINASQSSEMDALPGSSNAPRSHASTEFLKVYIKFNEGRYHASKDKLKLLGNYFEDEHLLKMNEQTKRRLNETIVSLEGKADLFRNEGNYAKAIEVLAGAAGMESFCNKETRKLACIWISIGHCFDDQKKYLSAIECFTQASNCDPNYYKSFYDRACTYFKIKNYTQAQLDIEECLKLRPDYENAQKLEKKVIDEMRSHLLA